MLKATPRAQLHLQRVIEKSATGRGDSVSASSDYSISAGGAPRGVYDSPYGKDGYSTVHRGSNGRSTTPLNKHRRASIMSINRDGRSASTLLPTLQNGALSSSVTPRGGEDGAGDTDEYVYDRNNQIHASIGDSNDGSDVVNGHIADDVVNGHVADGVVPEGRYSEDFAEEYAPRDSADRYGAADGMASVPGDASGLLSEDGAPMHASNGYRAGSGSGDRLGDRTGSGARLGDRSSTPQTIYDAEGNPICEVAFDEDGNPVTVTYDENGDPVYDDVENSPLPAAVVRELLNQREETRRLTEERDAMRARLEELERSPQNGGGYVSTPRVGASAASTHGYGDTPDNSVRNHDSHFLVSLPEESAMNRGMSIAPLRGGALGTPRSGPWSPTGGLASAKDEGAIYYDPQAAYECPEDAACDEAGARRRLVAAQDEAFLAILEEADNSIQIQHASMISFTRGGVGSDISSSRALVVQEQVLVALQQEKEIGELRNALAEAEEKIMKLEETNTALRLQLVLEKANRHK